MIKCHICLFGRDISSDKQAVFCSTVFVYVNEQDIEKKLWTYFVKFYGEEFFEMRKH